ncbi:Uncharacterized protein APZ42_022899 [Daphnia magna]|uniref:Uncharacterized protein n=1 Tax=Daphnia magna TaxID=35525 RepID=A0A164VX00_9CRUS|nr:Uncharacterized protein APZ42_022899 [Daphnia magna]
MKNTKKKGKIKRDSMAGGGGGYVASVFILFDEDEGDEGETSLINPWVFLILSWPKQVPVLGCLVAAARPSMSCNSGRRW